MRQFKVSCIALIITILSVSLSYGQSTVSPYSTYGVGIMAERGYASHLGMGNSGLAYGSPWFIPVLNPALLGSQTFSSFEAGMTMKNTAIRDEVNRFDQVNGGLQYLALAFPIIPTKVGFSVSLNPYSSKNYNLFQTFDESVTVRPQSKSFTGEGNISQFRFSSGWNITENISLGAEMNYNFGTITERVLTQNIINGADTINLLYQIASENENRYSDLSYLIGVRIRKNIQENTLALGATYALENNISTTRNNSLSIFNVAGNSLTANDQDSSNFRIRNEEGITSIPAKLSVGLSYYSINEWAVSADYTYQDWTTYKYFGTTSPSLRAASSINIGGEFTPNLKAADKYYERVTYRAGFYIKNGPVIIENTEINSFGVTFGASLPINKASNVNIGLEIGQRGTVENSLVRENYFGFNLSFTYNDRWFIRRQFD